MIKIGKFSSIILLFDSICYPAHHDLSEKESNINEKYLPQREQILSFPPK